MWTRISHGTINDLVDLTDESFDTIEEEMEERQGALFSRWHDAQEEG